MILTDTFANNKQSNIFSTALSENNARLAELNKQDIRVIVGNPPYSVGQDSQNDDNQNEHYDELDARLTATYIARTSSTLKGMLYDSYIRADRWASDRIGQNGVIGFVTNAGWLESSSADGMRKCMTEEFSSIYIYHLKGNARTQGVQRQKEKDNVFGEGSRAPVAIVFLVKNPESAGRGKIYFHAVEDYLSRGEKLAALKQDRSITSTPMQNIIPDAHGDWFNQREDSYSRFIKIGCKKSTDAALFKNFSCGVCTSRDAWAYGSNKEPVLQNIQRSIQHYNAQVISALKSPETFEPDLTSSKMKWDRPQKRNVTSGKQVANATANKLTKSLYRPFFTQYLYFDRFWNNCVYQMPSIFPTNKTNNLLICSSGVDNLIICINQNSKDAGQIAVMTDRIVDLHFNGDTQCFPRWLPGEKANLEEGVLDFGGSEEVPSGFSSEALPHFQAAYPDKPITEDDLFYYIYGILYSEGYRTRYANNLMKELPRIPRVATYEQFLAFSKAGRDLAKLHVHFEEVTPYAGVTLEYAKSGKPSYRVKQMKWGKIAGKTGNAAKDKTTLIYNDWITVKNIPLEAQEYIVNKKSALDWVVERACVSIDKASGIVNDFNDFATGIGNERYPLDLFLKVITVSLETMKIVKTLPKLEIHPLDK